jgi:radical SAM protein (TIGR01212 family)
MFNNTDKRYNQYSAHLKQKFGVKVYKVTLDAGFSCPNRDGVISSGGCIFCDDGGSFSQAHSNLLSIEEQLETGIETLSTRFKAKKFMSYFQAYSNTYKPVNELEKIYKSSLKHPDIVGISIGTRPDCVDREKLKLISGFKDDYYTWIEYGLQSIHDKTLRAINRGHDFDCFLKAYEMAKEAGINVCAHVILGLPDETKGDMLKTAEKLAELKVDGVKIHMLCALEGTKLSKMHEAGKISFMPEEDYIQTVCDFLEILPAETTIHRLAGNGLKKNLISPRWLGKKLDTLNKIDRELERRNSYQGIYTELQSINDLYTPHPNF